MSLVSQILRATISEILKDCLELKCIYFGELPTCVDLCFSQPPYYCDRKSDFRTINSQNNLAQYMVFFIT